MTECSHLSWRAWAILKYKGLSSCWTANKHELQWYNTTLTTQTLKQNLKVCNPYARTTSWVLKVFFSIYMKLCTFHSGETVGSNTLQWNRKAETDHILLSSTGRLIYIIQCSQIHRRRLTSSSKYVSMRSFGSSLSGETIFITERDRSLSKDFLKKSSLKKSEHFFILMFVFCMQAFFHCF